MNPVPRKRCAIYTRKSVEDGLEQEFNSLDAQREAAENYIASQKSNGWVCLPERYDDGGCSGGNINRPALRKLLSDAEAGLIDIIVVYKIDRLSRSLIDFAELSRKFEEWSVSFVSVTQEINTATSAGRMMLNILISFAQYEREVITERIRDKMSASRKKGLWVGGTVPFGYRVEKNKLFIVPEEAEIVKRIFERYVEVQSPKLIARELGLDGITTRKDNPWRVAGIYRMLGNRTYIGEVDYKGGVYKGEQAIIISPELWQRTRDIMENNSPVEKGSRKVELSAPLKGLLRCGHCEGAMIPSYGVKNGRKYYYYICSKDTKRSDSACPVRRVAAGDIEEQIKHLLKNFLSEPGLLIEIAVRTECEPYEVSEMFTEEFWREITPGELNRLITLLTAKAELFENQLVVEFRTANIKSFMERIKHATS